EFEGENVPYFAYGRTYKRIADEDRPLSKSELEKLILEKNKDKLLWDSKTNNKFTLTDISGDKLKSYVQDANLKYTSKKDVLEKLELIRDDKLTNASIILFGKNPSKYFSLLNLRCASFLGENKASTTLDMTDFDGDLFELITKAEQYILQYINVGMRLNGLRRVDVPEINKEAFREAIINAFCHRDYSIPQEVQIAIFKNKVEILNPGRLYAGLSIKDILSKPISERRNPLIADIFHKVDFVEKGGTGIGKIRRLEPKTKFEEISDFFLVTFKRKERGVENVPENVPEKRLDNILRLMGGDGKISIPILAKECNVNEKTIKRDISKLKELKLIKRVGPDKGGHWEVLE
ncbi:MAG: DeoR family transcriptional regulator, partial [Candidatus Aenigmarchaeota archaeon]|nr:DeoR family transcriptional regulator [Candidatus Aenigmarchaeota archaeon]